MIVPLTQSSDGRYNATRLWLLVRDKTLDKYSCMATNFGIVVSILVWQWPSWELGV